MANTVEASTTPLHPRDVPHVARVGTAQDGRTIQVTPPASQRGYSTWRLTPDEALDMYAALGLSLAEERGCDRPIDGGTPFAEVAAIDEGPF